MADANATKKYTLEEVKEHIMFEDAWLVIHDKVYNVTDFLEEHPGGEVIWVRLSVRRSEKYLTVFA